MKNFIYILLIGFVLLFFLFLFLVYPGARLLNNIPDFFRYVLNAFVFTGVVAYFIYLLVEIRSVYKFSRQSSRPQETKIENTEKVENVPMDTSIDAQKNYNELTRQLLQLMRKSFNAHTSFLYLYNKLDQQYILQNYVSNDSISLAKEFKVGGSIYSDITRRARPKIYDRSQFDSTYLIYYNDSQEIKSLMLVPVIVGDFVGIIGLDSNKKNIWDNGAAALAQNFAHLFSQFIWQVDALELQSNHINFLQDIADFHQNVSLDLSRLDFLKRSCRIINKYFSYDKLTVFSKNTDDSAYEASIEYIDGEDTEIPMGTHINNRNGLPKVVTDTGQIFIPDYDKSHLDFRFLPDDMESLHYRSAIGKKIAFSDSTPGGIILESKQANNYTKQDLDLLTFFCNSFNRASQALSKYQKTKTLGTVDSLTQLYNRRAFIDNLKREIERARRYDSTLTLLVLDIDDFKDANDIHGHPFGDFVLEKIARVLLGSVRSIDTIARYGGEKFTIILVNADKNDCIDTAERIRSNIENFQFKNSDGEHDITVSIGFASFPRDGENYKDIFANADKAMYEAKQAGKNQVTMYQS